MYCSLWNLYLTEILPVLCTQQLPFYISEDILLTGTLARLSLSDSKLF